MSATGIPTPDETGAHSSTMQTDDDHAAFQAMQAQHYEESINTARGTLIGGSLSILIWLVAGGALALAGVLLGWWN